MPPEETPPRANFATRFALYADNSLGSFVLSASFAILMLYNNVFPLDGVFWTELTQPDCGQTIWSVWLANRSITSGHNPYWTNLVYYPFGASLSHHTLALGYFPVTLLVKVLTGDDPMHPFYSYRLIVWLAFTLLLWSSYLFLREINVARWAAMTAATAYAFCDFFMQHIPHPNILAAFFVPLVALSLARLYRKPTTRRAVMVAATLGFSIYFTEFILHICLGLTLFTLTMCVFKKERGALGEKARIIGGRGMLLAGFVFLLIVTPFLLNFLTDKVIKPQLYEHSIYSANLLGLFVPKKDQTPLYGNLFTSLSDRITLGFGGYEVFIGFPLLIFAVLGTLTSKRRLVRLAAFCSLIFFVLSLGPTLKVFSRETGITLPYALLMKVPPFDMSRTPARFVVIGMFLLAIVGAHGMMCMQKALSTHYGKQWSAAAMLALFAWVTAEAYSPVPRQVKFVASPQLEKIVPGAVLNLPLSRIEGYGELLQTFHHQPIGVGYLSRNSERQLKQLGELEDMYKELGGKFCDGVIKAGFRNIIIKPDAPTMEPLELQRCPINVIDLRERPTEFPLYRIGSLIDLSTQESTPFLWFGWGERESDARWTTKDRAIVVFAPDKIPDRSEASVLRIQMSPFLLPGTLASQRIEIELNNRLLATFTLDDPAVQIYSIAVPKNVLRDKNLLSFRMPDAISPQQLKLNEDSRRLALSVHWLEFVTQNSTEAVNRFSDDKIVPPAIAVERR